MKHTIALVFLSILGTLAYCGYQMGYLKGLDRWYEVCSEAKAKEIKLESCGYYKWEAVNELRRK